MPRDRPADRPARAGRGLQRRRRQPRPNVDLTRRILELAGKPDSLIRHVPDRPGHDRRYSLDTSKLQRSAGRRRCGSRRGSPRRSRGTATTNGGGGRSRTPTRPSGVLRGAVRQPLSLTSLRTAARDRTRPASRAATCSSICSSAAPRSPPGRTAAGGTPTRRCSSAWSAVDLLDANARRPRRRRSFDPTVIYHCARLRRRRRAHGRARDRALRVNALGTHHLLEAARDAGLAVSRHSSPDPRWSTGRPSSRSTKRIRSDPADPYGVSKLAQEMLAAQARRPVILARPFNHAGRDSGGLRHLQLRAADRRNRSGTAPAGPARRQPRRAARHHGRARHRPGLPVADASTGRPSVLQRLPRHRLSGRRPAGTAARPARVRVTVQPDPARLRPAITRWCWAIRRGSAPIPGGS